MTASQRPKPLIWIGRTRKDLKTFPEDVQDVFGYALHLAQMGSKHPAAKPLKGFGGAGVLEIVDDHDGSTYRAVYTVKIGDVIYALHAFPEEVGERHRNTKDGDSPDQAALERGVPSLQQETGDRK